MFLGIIEKKCHERQMMKIERLMYILVTLLSQKYLKASEVAQMYQVSSRTIYRDIDTLSLAGIPIYSKQGTDGGFYIDENYKLNSLLFSDMEKKMLQELSLSLATSYKSPKLDELSKKMSYLVEKNKSVSPYFFDLTLWKTNQPFLEEIEEAMENNQVIEFEYTTFNGESSVRKVEPINLVFKSSVWYIYAFCRLRQEPRLFRVSRIRQVRQMEETFDPKKHTALSKETLEDFYTGLSKTIEMIPIVLEFKQEAKAKVYDSFLEKDITEYPEKIIVSKEMPKERWLVEMLMSFGGLVKVISPEFLQKEIIEEAQIILKQYDIKVSK
ncbi:YafY family protein [Vagococcus fluvialis]|uniref:helix-turn-helix transcriptional regulator n=3 Tax=Vagococcus fluvialis TaxID=2738 RepID=UPI0037AF7966